MASAPVLRAQLLGGIAAGLGSLALGVFLIVNTYTTYAQYVAADEALVRQRSVLALAQSVTSERARATLDMADVPIGTATLPQRRDETARSLDLVKMTLSVTQSADEQRALTYIEARLEKARTAIDAVLQKPVEARTRAEMTAAIRAMFATLDAVAFLREQTGQRAMRANSEIAADVIVITTVSALRDISGRIGGSTTVQLVDARDPTSRDLLNEFHQDMGRVTVLVRALTNVLGPLFGDAGVEKAVGAMQRRFIEHAMPLAARVSVEGNTGRETARTFTTSYLEGVLAIDALFEAVTTASSRKVAAKRKSAYAKLVWSVATTGVVLVALLAIGLLFRNQLFRPLRGAREQLAAIASGDLSSSLNTKITDELRKILPGIDVLRDHQRQLERDQKRLSDEVDKLAETDQLTGLLNRRALAVRSRRVLADADAGQQTVGVLVFDIDAFRWINAGGGYQAGDDALRKLAVGLRPHLGGRDLFARNAGDEFVIVLADTDRRQAIALAESLRGALAASTRGNLGPPLTGSFGLALREPGTPASWEEIVAIAERRMLAAKQAGGDRISFATADETPSDGATEGKAA